MGKMIRSAFGLIALCLATQSGAQAGPQCSECADTLKSEWPLRIEIRAALDFSRATIRKNGGQIRIDPSTGGREFNGDAVNLGGMPFAGTAIVTGEAGRAVRIDLPSTVRMTNSRGGTLMVRNLRTNLVGLPRLDAAGNLEFSFGGDLEISGNAFGEYRGRIPITAEYE
jgi:hypothetical protein